MDPQVNFQLLKMHLLWCVAKKSEYQKCSRNWSQNRQKRPKMSTFKFDVLYFQCGLIFCCNSFNDAYCHPLASIRQKPSYIEGQVILENLILTKCIFFILTYFSANALTYSMLLNWELLRIIHHLRLPAGFFTMIMNIICCLTSINSEH